MWLYSTLSVVESNIGTPVQYRALKQAADSSIDRLLKRAVLCPRRHFAREGGRLSAAFGRAWSRFCEKAHWSYVSCKE